MDTLNQPVFGEIDFEHIFDLSPNLIFILDRKHTIVRANESFSKQVGIPSELLVGSKCFWCMHKMDEPPAFCVHSLLLQDGKTHTTDVFIERLNGWFSLSVKPLMDKKGSITGSMHIARDITERKRKEEEIELKNEELIKLNAEKDKFFSIIAHDLRSPFQGFLGLTELMTEELPSMSQDEIQEMNVMMKDSASNLFRLLENLLEWARMQRGITTFHPRSILLKPATIENMATVQESANKKEIGISCKIPEDLVVFGDENMLGCMIRNLASNAVKFTLTGGKVTIAAKPISNGRIEISIKDTGIGMSKEMIDNLFRLDINTSRKGTAGEPSTGLGLIICKDFIEKHGSKLRIESEEEKGTTFYFTLPGQKGETLKQEKSELN